jgi:acetyltransferase-like isoleucine patch superfamily enzyme
MTVGITETRIPLGTIKSHIYCARVFSAPIGADTVVPAPRDRLARLRLTRLRLAARGRLTVRGHAELERGVRISVAPGARVVLEDGCLLGEGCRIEAAAGTITIGREARVGSRALLVALAGIDVGAGCMIGEWAVIADHEPTFQDSERPTRLQPLRAEPIRLGEGARIGAHAILPAGATVAPGEVVGSYETRAPLSDT